MLKTIIPFEQVPQLAKTDIAYATGDPLLKPFYRHEPKLSAFEAVIREKAKQEIPRSDLVEVLREQYTGLPEHAPVAQAIEDLLTDDTFTVTTAHQPNLFLGPLYFLYKAMTTINLAEAVQALQENKRIVPIFVLGSEDHDLEELNSIHLFNNDLVWETDAQGPVGSMSTGSLGPVLAKVKEILGDSEAAAHLFSRIEKAYTKRDTIAGATQAMLHDLFGKYGLVVLNMNDRRFKRHFVPVMKAELLEEISYGVVNKTIGRLNDLGFKTQASPREINLFYMQPGARERIVRENDRYTVLNTDLSFSEAEIIEELERYPERFSPNVILRPLFQETILPNLAYVGGGGELAYWLERKTLFEHFGIPFPMLVRRHSVLWMDRDAVKKWQKFGLDLEQIFEHPDSLVRQYVEQQAEADVDLGPEIEALHRIYDQLTARAAVIDPTLEKAVRAEEVKAVGGMEHWQNRLIRAEKQKHEVSVNQIRSLKEKLFPGEGLQERFDNFIPYLLKYGDAFTDTLKEQFQPFDPGFLILRDEE
ncbi:MAG: bacillithiol biosynthesis cysteine-adding enzyme BshC [Lewinellaceae bacterium]|nr:bacillithiol biosynthesis cysteine-adding enzyme BshC [Lewinellaceae bacterium]